MLHVSVSHSSIHLMKVELHANSWPSHVSKQATMVDRANTFKQQYDLVEATKLKEINLYDLKFVLIYSTVLLIAGYPSLFELMCALLDSTTSIMGN